MRCKICGASVNKIFDAKILNKYIVNYYFCDFCGFMQTEEPYWLSEAYNEAINIFDTGVMSRNIEFVKRTSIILFFCFDKTAKYLDYAGGYGVFTRLMRDVGFDFYWYDPYAKNLVARGFEYLETQSQEIAALTVFECFEHLLNPINEIEKMLKLSTSIIFSTNVLPAVIPEPKDWWYYGFEHGQHISFFSLRTLQFIAGKFQLNLYSDGTQHHIFTKNTLRADLVNVIFKNNPLSFRDSSRIIKPGTFKKFLKLLIKHVFKIEIDLLGMIKMNMQSKTMNDHNYLVNKFSGQSEKF